MNLLVTGGAGFIGSHVIRRFVNTYSDYIIYNLDALTYAGNLENLKDLENAANYKFVKGDITDEAFINNLFSTEQFDGVIHLAAESHVDRSIDGPAEFIRTNVVGTQVLLEAARKHWMTLDGAAKIAAGAAMLDTQKTQLDYQFLWVLVIRSLQRQINLIYGQSKMMRFLLTQSIDCKIDGTMAI